MTLDLTTYRERLNSYKVSVNEGAIDSIKKQILDNFYVNPSYEDVIISLEERGVHIVQEGVRGLRLLCKPNEDITSGEYVIWKDKEYLCTHRFPDDKVQAKGTIQLCNHYLKWIDKETGELIVQPCIEDARTLYTTGIREEELMEIPNGMVGIMLPYGDISRRMDRDDRFVFNKTSYRVTFYDETTYPGLVALICAEAGTSYLDDKVNEIANRWVEVNGVLVDRLPHLDNQEPDEPPIVDPEQPPSEGVSYAVEITKQYQGDTEYQLSSNNWQTYTVKKLVDNEEVDSSFDFVLSEDIGGLTLTKETDNSCELSTMVVYGKYNTNLIVTDIDTNELIIEQSIKINGR